MSELNKFTPGPWTMREVTHSNVPGQTAYAIDFNEDQEQVVDWVYEKADACLIIAAPDLLEALEKALDALAHCRADTGYSSMQMRAAHMADKAIKKARGQS